MVSSGNGRIEVLVADIKVAVAVVLPRKLKSPPASSSVLRLNYALKGASTLKPAKGF